MTNPATIRKEITAYYTLHMELEQTKQCTDTNAELLEMEKALSKYFDEFNVDTIGDLEDKVIYL